MPKSPNDVVATARSAFNSGKTKPYEFRLKQLKALQKCLIDNEQKMVQILATDNKKPKMESYLGELIQMKSDVQEAISHLKQWMQPVKPSKPLPNLMDTVQITKEPYGVVLIIGAWNYPLALTISPLIGAIAAGNCAIVKPSELAPGSAKLMEEELPKYLDRECYHVFNGGVPETTALLEHRFDYIFYTGSTAVGKIVYAAAAKHLTPVTLELGGKSPVYLDDSADVDVAAARIMWGKCVNAGQSCIEPDYLLCSQFTRDKFVQAAKKVVQQWYGDVEQSPDFCRIINDGHFGRVAKLLKGQNVVMGGKTKASDRFIEPTIVVDVKAQDPIMQEEIFGPVLPVLTVESPEEAIEFINARDKPLALYVFTTSKLVQDKFLKRTSSGGFVVNDVMVHYACHTLPFGGVGHSGIGAYHGEKTFDTFSHHKATLIKNLDKFGEMLQSVRYPPYTDRKIWLLTFLTKPLPSIPGVSPMLVLVVGMFFAFVKMMCK